MAPSLIRYISNPALSLGMAAFTFAVLRLRHSRSDLEPTRPPALFRLYARDRHRRYVPATRYDSRSSPLGRRHQRYLSHPEACLAPIHISVDMMRHQARGAAETDTGVKRGGPGPQRTTIFIHLFRFPEANVVPPPRVIPDRLLERQVLLATPNEKMLTGAVS